MSLFEGSVTLPAAADFHVHLRDGDMMNLVTPTIRDGGVDTVYVMPNLVPPITSVSSALAYKKRLQALSPTVNFLMTLYLSPDITPDTIREAATDGIAGVKVYPAGVTTNSKAGVVSLEPFYPVFAAMQEVDMVLNLHGEVPSTPPSAEAYKSLAVPQQAKAIATETTEPSKAVAATVMTAEPLFLPTLATLHAAFPRLRIVLEHCTTAAAVAAVRACGPNVRGTITAHHLYLTTDDVVGEPLNFCKPVAKGPGDRVALIQAALGNSTPADMDKFFFGSDSAPHPADKKRPGVHDEAPAAAGCFTGKHAAQLVVGAAEEAVHHGWIDENGDDGDGNSLLNRLAAFLSTRGRRFYQLVKEEDKNRLAKDSQSPSSSSSSPLSSQPQIVLEKRGERIDDYISLEKSNGSGGDALVQVVPFRRGQETWSLRWL